MVKMYDFGTDTSNVSANTRKSFAWPISVWSCYIPESEKQGINILENLILQLIHHGVNDPLSVLCGQVEFNKDLVNAAIEECKNRGYIRKDRTPLVLNKSGESLVAKMENPFAADLESSVNHKKVYMIQDLVTQSVIPVFDIEKLPEFYIEDENVLEIKGTNTYNQKPKSVAIKTALVYWAKMCNEQRKGLNSGTNSIDISEPPKVTEEITEFIPYEDEVDWESVGQDETGNGDEMPVTSNTQYSDEVKTLADKEEEEKSEKAKKDLENITILDDTPEKYYARGYIAININSPDEIVIVSPFGTRLDNWFRTVINRMRASDPKFEEELQLFLLMKQDELKDKIAFGNDLNIRLFNEFPFICNNKEYKAVATTIRRLTVSFNRFQNGEDDTINFAQAIRTAYEASLRLIIKKNTYFEEAHTLSYDDYKDNLSMLVNSYSFFSHDVFNEYKGFNLYNNMTRANGDDGYATAFVALILMDAWKDKSGKSMEFLRNMPEFPIRIKELTSNLKRDIKRNKKGDGTAASHGGDAIADLKFSLEKAEQQYVEFENTFRALYNRFMEK